MSDQIRHDLVGRTVDVMPCGDKSGFTGRVISAWFWKVKDKPAVIYFHVEDPSDGSVWHREIDELVAVPAAIAA